MRERFFPPRNRRHNRNVELVVRLISACIAIPALLAAQDAREIVRRACDLDQKNLEISRNYTYLQRQEERDLDGSGNVKSREVRTWDVTRQEGSPYRRLVARNDQPLSPKEQQFEQEKLEKSIEQRRGESPAERQRRIAEWQRRQEKQREPARELPDAFDFRIVGEESLNGGDTWVIDATPKPGYKPKSAAAVFFPKVMARLWIEKSGYEWVKVDMETLDTIAFGGILVRIGKGGHLLLEQTRVNQEVWLPKRVRIDISGRLLLVKGIHRGIEMTFSDYKKFQAESRVVSTEAR
ncbi:MAG TPA: hypothetical protein VE959_15835 [Bryobacteraceae bacterium]|nr:hypothetical protein [Bryobacteraceae bacterium]